MKSKAVILSFIALLLVDSASMSAWAVKRKLMQKGHVFWIEERPSDSGINSSCSGVQESHSNKCEDYSGDEGELEYYAHMYNENDSDSNWPSSLTPDSEINLSCSGAQAYYSNKYEDYSGEEGELAYYAHMYDENDSDSNWPSSLTPGTEENISTGVFREWIEPAEYPPQDYSGSIKQFNYTLYWKSYIVYCGVSSDPETTASEHQYNASLHFDKMIVYRYNKTRLEAEQQVDVCVQRYRWAEKNYDDHERLWPMLIRTEFPELEKIGVLPDAIYIPEGLYTIEWTIQERPT